jgi:archaeal flagellar protein FlaJ
VVRMAFFGAKKEENKEQDEAGIVGFTKPKRFLFFKVKSKPIYGAAPANADTGVVKINIPWRSAHQEQHPAAQSPDQTALRANLNPQAAKQAPQARSQMFDTFGTAVRQQTQDKETQDKKTPAAAKSGRPSQLDIYFASIAAKHKGLDVALRAQGIKESPLEFVRKMFFSSLILSVLITIAVGALMLSYEISPILAIVLGIACFQGLFNRFIKYPMDRSTVVGKDIEKDILFAARDLVISMRSGMPLFNAITAVSTGYGAASLEFAKVVELVQLGSPIEQALDDVSSRSQSRTFKRIMLQATVSLKAGADVVGALQGVVEEVQQERVIELRRYGQRLNALAMFYMLFGVIFPSMGIAVAAILTTFINIFSVTESTLLMAIVGIFFLQIIFLNIMRGSRPTFAM